MSRTVVAASWVRISSTSLCKVTVLIYDYPLAMWLAPVFVDAVRVPDGEYHECGKTERGRIIVGEPLVIGVL